MRYTRKRVVLTSFLVSLLVSILMGGFIGLAAGVLASRNGDVSDFISEHIFRGRFVEAGTGTSITRVHKVEEESSIISVAEDASPAVVSIIVSKDVPVYESVYEGPFDRFFDLRVPLRKQNGTEKKVVGGGTGFIISNDGYVITNKHVVVDEGAEYTVVLDNDEEYAAKVLARDLNNDVAVLKIEGDNFSLLEIGDSTDLKVGQTVIAIGNALNEFRNTVSTGVISGLSRSITAHGAGIGSEDLSGLIQTDASINMGNSGGPLLNIGGQVIGLNTAVAASAENIGFAIPMDDIKPLVESVKEHGRVVKPWLGVRFVQVTPELAESNMLEVDYGALVLRGEKRTDLAVIPGSPADKAGILENDIILEVGGQKLTLDNPLHKVVATFKPGDRVIFKILHKGEEKEVIVTMEEAQTK